MLFARLALLGLLAAGLVQAYPNMIRLGYTSCTSCHHSPRGGGLLTDYGKGIGGATSYFMEDYEAGQPSSLQHGGQARGMFLKNGAETVVFPMQLDYLGRLKFAKNHTVETTIGYVPPRGQTETGALRSVILRRAAYVFRANKNSEWLLGRGFLPFGLNTADHSLWIRARNRRWINDLQTQLRYDWWSRSLHLTPFVYLPSYSEVAGNGESGAGARLEFYPTKRSSLGALTLFGSTSAIRRTVVTLFGRWSLDESWGLMAEYDFTQRKLDAGETPFVQHALFFKPYWVPLEWLELAFVMETLQVGAPFAEDDTRYGPELSFRVWRHLGGQVNFRRSSKDSELLAQLFAHF